MQSPWSMGGLFSIFAYALFMRWLTKKGYKQRGEQLIRGNTCERKENLIKLIQKKEQASDLQIEGLPLIKDSELKHIAVHGTTGAGKSQLIMQLLDQIKHRPEDRVILLDKGCTYTPHYYDASRGDGILNSVDERCLNWDLWDEAKHLSDFNDLAAGLMPIPRASSDPVWVTGARTIWAQTAFKMREDDDRCIEKLNFLTLKAPLPILQNYLKGTIAAPLASVKTAKTSLSFRATLITYIQAFEFLQAREGKPFSIRQWMRETDKGWLFISSDELHEESLRPLMSMWFGQATQQLLSLRPNIHRRIWFICDELPSYHYLKQVVNALPRARKFGGCFVLGMQSYPQLQDLYGVHRAKEMFDLLNTRFFFRSTSSEVADFVSKELGEQEIKEFRENMSYGADTIRDGVSSGHYRTKRRLIYYPEILDLKDMHCFVQLPEGLPITKLEVKYKDRDWMAEANEPIDEDNIESTWQPPKEWLDEEEGEEETHVPNTQPETPEKISPTKKEPTKKKKTTKGNKKTSKKTSKKQNTTQPKNTNQSADHHHTERPPEPPAMADTEVEAEAGHD